MITRAVSLAAAFAIVTCATGCVASETFRAGAFVPGPRHYRVRYAREGVAMRAVLPTGWSILNYRTDGEGRPTQPFAGHQDLVRIAVDADGDRDVDVRATAPRYDLHFQHDEDGSEIAVMTVPLDGRLARRSLGILAHALIDGAFGDGFVEWQGDRARSYQTRIVEEQEVTVGGASGYLVTFEIAQVVPGVGASFGRGVTSTIVLVRPGELRWRGGDRADRATGAPMLVLAMLDAPSGRYELHRGDFESLLHRLDIRPDGLAQ